MEFIFQNIYLNLFLIKSNSSIVLGFNELSFFKVYRGDIIPIDFYLKFAFFLFFLGLFGVALNRKNVLIVMLFIELLSFGVIYNFIIFSRFFADPCGENVALLLIAVVAADSATGLAILVNAFHLSKNIEFGSFSNSKG